MKRIITVLCTILCLCFCININAEGLVAIDVSNHVSGYIGMKIPAAIVDIKLDPSSPDATFNNVKLDDDVTDWFTNIPKGLSARVNEIINNDELKVEINGVVDSGESEGTTQIAVTIPEGYIKYGLNVYEADLDNTPSNKAKYKLENYLAFEIKYHDAYEIVGEVGKELEPQDVVVEIVNCGSDADDFDYENILGVELPMVNGLTPTVTDYDDVDLTITITYTGTPLKESHDLIHTTVLKEYMINGTDDRVVPDRDDVLFNIVDNTPHVDPIPDVPSPKPIPVFVLPNTGVN